MDCVLFYTLPKLNNLHKMYIDFLAINYNRILGYVTLMAKPLYIKLLLKPLVTLYSFTYELVS